VFWYPKSVSCPAVIAQLDTKVGVSFIKANTQYHGKDDVNVIGDRYGKIRPEQVQKMVSLSKKFYERKQRELEKLLMRWLCHDRR
jgi:hypothetical protein